MDGPELHELYAADDKGDVYIINVYHEDKVVTKKLSEKKINRIQILRNEREPNVFDEWGCLLVHTDYSIQQCQWTCIAD